MEPAQIDARTVLRRADGVALGELPEEAVLLDIDGETAVRLNASGNWLWGRLESPASVGDLSAALADHFGIDGGRAETDVTAFAGDLLGRGMLETA
jgi:coenzyme PQQ synthesis protein D (PqqD)